MSKVPEEHRLNIKTPLYKGMQGKDVENLQAMLNLLNEYYSFDSIRKQIPTTGYFGDQTARMLICFQDFWRCTLTVQFDTETKDIMEWKYYNYIQTQYAAMQKSQASEAFNERKW